MKKYYKHLYQYLLAFLCPIIFYCILCIILKIYPFGDTSNLRWDLYIQYTDYFSYYRNVLLGNDNIAYSFTKSLGGSMTSLWGYYLASPINLLLVFFKPENISAFIFMASSLKIGLSGLTMFIFSKRKFKNAPWYFVLFLSIAYSFTQYNVGQIANINWLDGVYMLPLMLIGVELYVEKRKPLFLYLTTAISIVFNWYTGYMNCIFIFLYFLYHQFLTDKSGAVFQFKSYLKKTVKFAMLEILSVMLGMVVLLPVFISQSGGRSAFDKGIFYPATNGRFLDILRGFLIGSPQPSNEITLFCTIFLLIFVMYFFRSSQINKVDKMAAGTLLLIMVFSLFFTPLEYIWCGFKFIGSYAFRFLYIPILTMLIIAGRALQHAGKLDKKILVQNTIGAIGILLILDLIQPFDGKRLWLQIILLGIYTFILMSLHSKKFVRYAGVICITALFTGEVILNARWIADSTFTEDANTIKNYIHDESLLVEQIRQYDSSPFYRMEKTLNKDKDLLHNSFFANESMAYSYSGIQHYSSSFDSITAALIENLGYCNGEFPTFFHTPLLPADSLLGIKYLLSENQYDGYTRVDGLKSYNQKDVYENQFSLPMALSVSDDVSSVELTDNPFENINNIYSGILGRETVLMKPIENVTITEVDNSVVFDIPSAGKNQILYAAFAGEVDAINADMYVNDNLITRYQNGWMHHNALTIGNMEGENTIRMDNFSLQDKTYMLYSMDMEVFQNVISQIKGQYSPEIHISGSRVTVGGVSSTDRIMLSIPYDDSWSASVNGKQADILKGAGGLIVIPVSAGDELKILLEYHVKGAIPGAVISLLSIILYVCAWLYKKRHS